MLAEPAVEHLARLAEALTEQLAAVEGLAEATQRVVDLAAKGVEPQELEKALACHAALFAACRKAETKVRKERFAWHALTGRATWSLTEMEQLLGMETGEPGSRLASQQREAICRTSMRLQEALEHLRRQTKSAAGVLQERLHQVAGQVQSVRRGRHASVAYAAGQEPRVARFIDRQE